MYASVLGASLHGIEGYVIHVEVNITLGMPAFEIVGLPNAAIREAKERVRAAIVNSGFEFPMRRIIVNLAPAHLRKEGSGLDLAIALGILVASKQLKREVIAQRLYVSELSLQGDLRPVKGFMAMAINAHEQQIKEACISLGNYEEGKISPLEHAKAFRNLKDLINYLIHNIYKEPLLPNKNKIEETLIDIGDVKGQLAGKRALEIAAAGGHNLLLIGPPGSGKSMLAKRIVTLLPPLHEQEQLEVMKIYSIAGLMDEHSLSSIRPFRAPHHTITLSGMAGGGAIPKPGEVTLSHHGVLYLDELPEFQRTVLEVLRQPLEEGKIHISRNHGAYVYPARFSLIASMNPCPCGYLGDRDRECICTSRQVASYRNRLSGPLLDRFDMFVSMLRPTYEELMSNKGYESSLVIRERVYNARERQAFRLKELGLYTNQQMSHKEIRRVCKMTIEGENLLQQAFKKMNFSIRAYDRLIRVAQTICDLKGITKIGEEEIAEALSFRDRYNGSIRG